MPVHTLLLATALAAAAPVLAQAPALTPHQRLARDIYRELIEINTADSTGSVTRAAEALAGRFRAAGFPAEDVRIVVREGAPTDGNLIVRYRGRGAGAGRKPILLLAHLDVVAALRSDWSLDPFVLTEKDGYFYGRGTSDDKAMAAIFAANLLRARRRAGSRTVTSSSPSRPTRRAGAQRRRLAGEGTSRPAGRRARDQRGRQRRPAGREAFLHSVQAAEKIYADFSLTVTNRGGHSASRGRTTPSSGSARRWPGSGSTPSRCGSTPVTRAYFEEMARLEEPGTAAAMRAILRNERDAAAARKLSATPRFNATLRTTCTPTLVSGGHAHNALPQLVTANVNCRILPGETVEEIQAALGRIVADTAIRIAPLPANEPRPRRGRARSCRRSWGRSGGSPARCSGGCRWCRSCPQGRRTAGSSGAPEFQPTG